MWISQKITTNILETFDGFLRNAIKDNSCYGFHESIKAFMVFMDLGWW
jgi:hypothetical protein